MATARLALGPVVPVTIEFPRHITHERAVAQHIEQVTGIPADLVADVHLESAAVQGQVLLRVEVIPFSLTPEQAGEMLSIMTGVQVVIDS